MNIIQLSNGRQAVSFVPEDSKELAIVHLSTIKRLARMLPKAGIHDIRAELLSELATQDSLTGLVNTCNEFVSFHETVNLIEKYDPTQV